MVEKISFEDKIRRFLNDLGPEADFLCKDFKGTYLASPSTGKMDMLHKANRLTMDHPLSCFKEEGWFSRDEVLYSNKHSGQREAVLKVYDVTKKRVVRTLAFPEGKTSGYFSSAKMFILPKKRLVLIDAKCSIETCFLDFNTSKAFYHPFKIVDVSPDEENFVAQSVKPGKRPYFIGSVDNALSSSTEKLLGNAYSFPESFEKDVIYDVVAMLSKDYILSLRKRLVDDAYDGDFLLQDMVSGGAPKSILRTYPTEFALSPDHSLLVVASKNVLFSVDISQLTDSNGLEPIVLEYPVPSAGKSRLKISPDNRYISYYNDERSYFTEDWVSVTGHKIIIDRFNPEKQYEFPNVLNVLWRPNLDGGNVDG